MKKPISRKAKHAEARRLYLKAGGRISFKELAEQVGASAKSIGLWCREDGWQDDVSIVATEAKERGVVKAVDAVEQAFEADIRHIQLLGQQIERQLMQPKLSAAEIKSLSTAKAECVKLLRLMTDRSTENTAAHITGGHAHGPRRDPEADPIHKAGMLIMSGHDPDGVMQQKLTDMMFLYQEVAAFGNKH